MTSSIIESDFEFIDRATAPLSAFRGATIVVTGCAGFLGLYLTTYLASRVERLGIKRVIGLDNFMFGEPDRLRTLRAASGGRCSIHGFDVTRDELDAVEGAAEACYLVHCASIASPSRYRSHPLETIDANVGGLRRLLEASKRNARLRGFLFMSSSEIYGDPDAADIPTPETYEGRVQTTGPRACYDESKRLGETLCWIYAHRFGMPIVIARPFNNYGPGMDLHDRRLPADLARSVIEGRDIDLFSDGSPTRTFCYVADAIVGYIKCLTLGRYDVFNIGSDGAELSVAEFAEVFRATAASAMGYTGAVRMRRSLEHDYLVDNPRRRRPSIEKARRVLGFKPAHRVDQGVHRWLEHLRQTRGEA